LPEFIPGIEPTSDEIIETLFELEPPLLALPLFDPELPQPAIRRIAGVSFRSVENFFTGTSLILL
jgi:hypothetical protein